MFHILRKCTRSPYSLLSSSHFSTNNIFFTISLYLPSSVIWLFFLWMCCYWVACIIHMYKSTTILNPSSAVSYQTGNSFLNWGNTNFVLPHVMFHYLGNFEAGSSKWPQIWTCTIPSCQVSTCLIFKQHSYGNRRMKPTSIMTIWL